MTEHRNVSRGLGNQVTVEFNLLYRFHCAISLNDEDYTEKFMKETFEEIGRAMNAAKQPADNTSPQSTPDPKSLSMMQFAVLAKTMAQDTKAEPWLQEFGLKNSETQNFRRNTLTGLFDDQQMVNQLRASMDDPICRHAWVMPFVTLLMTATAQFGPRNVPRSLKNVEIMGILQARKWYGRLSFHIHISSKSSSERVTLR